MNTICIMCPMGCGLEIEKVGDEIRVSGNTCKRGEAYGKAEFTHPVRTVTTLVKLEDGSVASCKTDAPVPKERVSDVVAYIGSLTLDKNVKIGDRFYAYLDGLDTDIVITGTPTSGC